MDLVYCKLEKKWKNKKASSLATGRENWTEVFSQEARDTSLLLLLFILLAKATKENKCT